MSNSLSFRQIGDPSSGAKSYSHKFIYRSSSLDTGYSFEFNPDNVTWLADNHFIIEGFAGRSDKCVLECNIFDKNGQKKCLSKLFTFGVEFGGSYAPKSYAFVLDIAEDAIEFITSCGGSG